MLNSSERTSERGGEGVEMDKWVHFPENLKTRLARFAQHNKSRFSASDGCSFTSYTLSFWGIVGSPAIHSMESKGKGREREIVDIIVIPLCLWPRMMNHFISGIPILARLHSDGLIGWIRGTSLSGYRSEEGHKCIALNLLAFVEEKTYLPVQPLLSFLIHCYTTETSIIWAEAENAFSFSMVVIYEHQRQRWGVKGDK